MSDLQIPETPQRTCQVFQRDVTDWCSENALPREVTQRTKYAPPRESRRRNIQRASEAPCETRSNVTIRTPLCVIHRHGISVGERLRTVAPRYPIRRCENRG